MRYAQSLSAWIVLLGIGLAAQALGVQPSKVGAKDLAAAERDVRAFYDSYAEDLHQHRREAIADRYDPRVAYSLGNGAKTLTSLESIRSNYRTKWTGPKSFAWRDLSIEVLSPDAAVVLGRFNWQRDTGDTMTFSYTGVLIKHHGAWRIRVEDESARCAKPSAQ